MSFIAVDINREKVFDSSGSSTINVKWFVRLRIGVLIKTVTFADVEHFCLFTV